MAAVRQNGFALYDASEALRANREIVLAAVLHYAKALGYASAELRNDRELVFEAVSRDGATLEYASEAIRDDMQEWSAREGILRTALRNDGRALQFLSSRLRADRDIVMGAVTRNGDALKYAATELKNDRDVVFMAVQEPKNLFDGRVQQYRGSPVYRRHLGNALAFASDEQTSDPIVCLAAILHNPKAELYISEDLHFDSDFQSARQLIERGRAGEDLAALPPEQVRESRRWSTATSPNLCSKRHPHPNLTRTRTPEQVGEQEEHGFRMLELLAYEIQEGRAIELRHSAEDTTDHERQQQHSPTEANAEVEQAAEEKAAEEKKARGKPGMKKLLDAKKKSPATIAKDATDPIAMFFATMAKDVPKGKNGTTKEEGNGTTAHELQRKNSFSRKLLVEGFGESATATKPSTLPPSSSPPPPSPPPSSLDRAVRKRSLLTRLSSLLCVVPSSMVQCLFAACWQ